MGKHATVVSFRTMLTEAVDAFLDEQAMASRPTAEALGEIVVGLGHYREEGTALYPLVFLCDDLDALLTHVDGADALALGHGPESPDTVRRALKTCAPLAQGGWSAYFERHDGGLRYGVFRTDDFVLRETPLEVLRRTDDPKLRAVGVVRVADDVVELRGGVGPSRYVYLSGARTDGAPPGVVSRELLTGVTRDCDPARRNDLYVFYRRVLLDVVRASHGTLLVVVPAHTRAEALFQDGVFLPEPVDVGAVIAAYRAHADSTTRASLQALRALLRGMLSSDGITVLRSDGAIVAFNVFVSHASSPDSRSGATPGGARRRTFEALTALVGHGLVAAFYRSQDGHAECRRIG